MSNIDDDIQAVPSSGNLFRDAGLPNAELEHLRARLAGKIMRVLDDEGLTAKQAHELTGIDEADFSRIRKLKLERFTVDRLMTVLNRLGQDVEISVDVHPRRSATASTQPGLI
jgi:predicted XRE-type DNA-binding protein